MLKPNTLLQQRYLIGRLIAKGGMGAIYEAKDERLDTLVALKQTFFTDELLSQAFKSEARLLANLRHPALPRVIDYFAEANSEFLVMEFVFGDDIANLLTRNKSAFPVN